MSGKNSFSGSLTRRSLFKSGGLAALAGVAGSSCAKGGKKLGPVTTYESIGVRPVINCYGTMTILSGSLQLPEVNAAMEEAARHYVHMDELMEAAGKRLAELTGAEWGGVFSGAAGALAASTAACMTGADPEKMALLPDVSSLKHEVLIHRSSRNVYDRSVWMTGAKMVEVQNAEEMDKMANEKTAAIYLLGEGLDGAEDITLEQIVTVGKKHGIPIIVDAAAEQPNVPNMYLEAGCDLVTYSGGKCLRGPQSAGLLLGRKDLIQAAFLNNAPHHSFGRPMKVGKEEIVGMVAAMEMWVKYRDHAAEAKEFERRMNYIKDRITAVPGVTAEVNLPTHRSNVAATLSISWEQEKVKISPQDAHTELREGVPRIWMPSNRQGLHIMSYMMEEDEEVIVANRLKEIFTKASA
ncbi:MAG: aminotransferase class V-fold PLP-dependent enzyme [Candidatus Latescibacterota bacterium]